MSQTTGNDVTVSVDEYNAKLQVFALVAVIGLLLLTSYGNAGIMFWLSLGAIFIMSVWFLVNRKIWLAIISSTTFVIAVLAFTKSLF